MQKSQHTTKYKKLTAALRAAREAAGFTQAQVAQKLRLYASFVAKLESGERRIDVIELARFCELYGVTLVEFLESAELA